jgi:hypothetical protein
MSQRSSGLSRLAAPAFGALMVLCCLAGPALIGAAGALTAGSLFGIGAALVVLAGLCLLLSRRLHGREGPSC